MSWMNDVNLPFCTDVSLVIQSIHSRSTHRRFQITNFRKRLTVKPGLSHHYDNRLPDYCHPNTRKYLLNNSLLRGYIGTVTTGAEQSAMSVSQMEKNLFNLKFAVKDLERNSKKCEKEEKIEKAKIKKAIQKGNMEGAKIHAENAIRQKNQALNYLRMSARVDAVASRVQTALTTRKVTQSMAGVVKAMDAAMKSMNLEKISGLMDKFESQFEDLDVQSSYMENAMSQTTTTNVPQNDVDSLMQQVADEAGLELNMELPSGQMGSIGTSTAVSQEQDELTQRLARLRE